VIEVSNVNYTNDSANDIVTFDMTKNGAAFDCTQVQNLNIYWVGYDGESFVMDPAARMAIKGTLSDNGAGGCTSTNAQSANGNLDAQDGLVVVYGYDGLVDTLPPSRVRQVQFP